MKRKLMSLAMIVPITIFVPSTCSSSNPQAQQTSLMMGDATAPTP